MTILAQRNRHGSASMGVAIIWMMVSSAVLSFMLLKTSRIVGSTHDVDVATAVLISARPTHDIVTMRCEDCTHDMYAHFLEFPRLVNFDPVRSFCAGAQGETNG